MDNEESAGAWYTFDTSGGISDCALAEVTKLNVIRLFPKILILRELA